MLAQACGAGRSAELAGEEGTEVIVRSKQLFGSRLANAAAGLALLCLFVFTLGAHAQTTDPIVSGEGAVAADGNPLEITFDTSAPVQATIDPNGGGDTTYSIEYGTTTSYGQNTGTFDAGSGAAQTVSQTLGGLQPNTTYHFRFDATNGSGTTNGTDATFTTGPQFTATLGAQVSGTLASGFGCPTTATVNWGDGTPTDSPTPTCVSNSATTFTLTDSHTYASAGHFDISVVLTLASGGKEDFGAGAQISAPSGGGGNTAPAPTPPVVTGQAAQVVTGTSATVSAQVNPNGLPTTYVVQYGPTSSYGQSTPSATAGSGTTPQTVTATLTGLTASSTYHYRFVATSSAGTTNATDLSLVTTTGGTTDLTSETPPPPVEGVSANLLPFRGTVLVNGKQLLVGEQIPFGATIDTTHGTVVLITMYNGVLQTFQFAGGVFVLTQGPNGITLLTLTGGNFAGICGTRKSTRNGLRELGGRAAPKPAPPLPHAKPTTVRSLWGNGQGHFEVQGKYAAATVRGTNFHVADRCDGTLVHVRHGIVAVFDVTTGKTILLTAGKSYLAQ
jgi:hypothetical protein